MTDSCVEFVSFDQATYQLTCQSCGNDFHVKGRALANKSHVTCPYHDASDPGRKNPVKSAKACLDDGQMICYSRIKDLFSYSGRIGVGGYWLGALLLSPLLILFMMADKSSMARYAISGFPLMFFLILHPLWVKRLHDHGLSGHWLWFNGVFSIVSSVVPAVIISSGKINPVLGFVTGISGIGALTIGVMISFVSGQKSTNRYGPNPSTILTEWLWRNLTRINGRPNTKSTHEVIVNDLHEHASPADVNPWRESPAPLDYGQAPPAPQHHSHSPPASENPWQSSRSPRVELRPPTALLGTSTRSENQGLNRTAFAILLVLTPLVLFAFFIFDTMSLANVWVGLALTTSLLVACRIYNVGVDDGRAGLYAFVYAGVFFTALIAENITIRICGGLVVLAMLVIAFFIPKMKRPLTPQEIEEKLGGL